MATKAEITKEEFFEEWNSLFNMLSVSLVG
jgi:hypothetical protein